MHGALLSPILLFTEVMLLLTLGAAGFWLASGGDLARPFATMHARVVPAVERQRDVAAALGWSVSTWITARVLAVLAGLFAGASTGIPVAVFGGLVAGMFGFPWVMAARGERRRLRTERSFVAMVREVRDRMVANTAFDQALRDVAENASGDLGRVLQPLLGDSAIAQALVEVDRRARSPLASMICVSFMVSRTRNQAALVNVLSNSLLPAAEAALMIETEGEVTAAQQRTIIYIMLLIEVGSLWYISTVPTFHAYYSNVLGQLTLVVIAVMFMGLIALVGRIMRRPAWTRWDVDRLRREFEAAGLA
jgi:hypothetical protein